MEIDCLQRNGTNKSQITLDRHNAILKLNYWPLPNAPNFSLPSTFKALDPYWIRIRIGIQPKMLDPDPDEMNADPQPWFLS
jgi:hypothetical protein